MADEEEEVSEQVGPGPYAQRYDAFLAYNSKDRAEATWVHEHLDSRGLEISPAGT